MEPKFCCETYILFGSNIYLSDHTLLSSGKIERNLITINILFF